MLGYVILGLFWVVEMRIGLDCGRPSELGYGEGSLGFGQLVSENGFGSGQKIRIKINKDNNTIVITIVKMIIKLSSESKNNTNDDDKGII